MNKCNHCKHADLKETYCDPNFVCLLNEKDAWEYEELIKEQERSAYIIGSYNSDYQTYDFQR